MESFFFTGDDVYFSGADRWIMEEIKRYLQSYNKLKAKKEVVDKIISETQDHAYRNKHKNLEIEIQIIDSCLQILDTNERKIISWHLLEHKKWKDILSMCQNQSEDIPNYSERTLKRIQKNALEKIRDFINANDWDNYIKEEQT